MTSEDHDRDTTDDGLPRQLCDDSGIQLFHFVARRQSETTFLTIFITARDDRVRVCHEGNAVIFGHV